MPQGRQAPGVRPELCRGTAWRRPMGSIWVPAAETQTATSLGAERANAHSAHGCTTYPGLRRGSCAGRPDGAGEPLRRRLSPQAGRFVPARHKAQQGLWLRASVGGLRREVEASLGRHLLRGLRESGEGRRLSPAGAVAAFGRASGREESFRDPWFLSHRTCPLSHPFSYRRGLGLRESREGMLGLRVWCRSEPLLGPAHVPHTWAPSAWPCSSVS